MPKTLMVSGFFLCGLCVVWIYNPAWNDAEQQVLYACFYDYLKIHEFKKSGDIHVDFLVLSFATSIYEPSTKSCLLARAINTELTVGKYCGLFRKGQQIRIKPWDLVLNNFYKLYFSEL